MRFKSQVVGWMAAGVISIILSFLVPVSCYGKVQPELFCQAAKLTPDNYTYLGILAIIIAIWVAIMGDRIYNFMMKQQKKTKKTRK